MNFGMANDLKHYVLHYVVSCMVPYLVGYTVTMYGIINLTIYGKPPDYTIRCSFGSLGQNGITDHIAKPRPHSVTTVHPNKKTSLLRLRALEPTQTHLKILMLQVQPQKKQLHHNDVSHALRAAC